MSRCDNFLDRHRPAARLRIGDGHTGRLGRLHRSRTQGAQVAVNALPSAVIAPGSEVAIHGLPRRKVRRQHAPGAAGTQDIQNGLDHGSQVGVAKPPQRGIGGELDRECLPVRLAQPSGVGWGGSFHGLSSLFFGKTAYAMEAP